MVIEGTESVEGIAERGVGLVVKALCGQGGAQHLPRACGERRIVVSVADDHQRLTHRLVVLTVLHQVRGPLVEGCSTIRLRQLGIAQGPIESAQHLGARTVGARNLIRERVELLA